jgi:hypothetical protein
MILLDTETNYAVITVPVIFFPFLHHSFSSAVLLDDYAEFTVGFFQIIYVNYLVPSIEQKK